ncbi:MAG: VOC family protein [Planctomycetaceae bacterium]
MSDYNTRNNRAVWFDIPVADLERACGFYSAVLSIKVSQEQFGDVKFAVLEHEDGNGGCLVPNADEVASDRGILLYLNVDGRIRDAVAKVESCGGSVVQPIHAIGPHGFRSIVLDSEGNRIVLHSNRDA